ncbi:MAG: sulfurtransferase [Hydrogenophilus sp.]
MALDYRHTLISVEEAQAWIATGRAVVIDCRFELADPDAGAAMYRAAHLPGAVFWDLERDLSGPKGIGTGRHPLPSIDAFAELIARASITPQTQVILYDEWDGMNAARAWWMLHACGYAATAVLDGGFRAWRSAKLPVTKEIPLPPHRYQIPNLPSWKLPIVETDEVTAACEQREVLLLDARAPERYRGEVEPFDPVPGHIPGAVNRFFRANVDASTGRFRPAEVLRAEFESLLAGRDPALTIHYCGSGVTACHNLLAWFHSGLPFARLYPGSWGAWCSDPRRPVACPARQDCDPPGRGAFERKPGAAR